MARESYTSSTLGEPIPHTGVESDLNRHPYTMKLKNKFSFGLPQDRSLLWATDPLVAQRGCAFCTPPFWALGQVTPNPKKLGGCNFGTPHFGPLGVTGPFLQFWTPEHQRTAWTTFALPIPNLSPANPPILGQT